MEVSNGCELHLGDCLDVMAGLPECSVDAVVTDSPYGLKFMGKEWDHGLPGVPFWEAALRVAKPGAHLLAFGGTRTFHRLTCALEDAGWEIRDCLSWIYGSGFPKSLDVSKALDKAAHVRCNHCRGTGIEVLDDSDGEPAEEVPCERCDGKGYTVGAKREVVGKHPDPRHQYPNTDITGGSYIGGRPAQRESGILTAPATPAAQKWDGWGTALKPAWEPIILARKPLDGTVAQNVTRWGCGALAVDKCRVGLAQTEDVAQLNARSGGKRGFATQYVGGNDHPLPAGCDLSKGRWPANLIHDGSEEVVAGFPVPHGAGHAKCSDCKTSRNSWFTSQESESAHNGMRFGDSGSAARFFKCCPVDVVCILCALPLAPRHGIMNTRSLEGELPCDVKNADSNLTGAPEGATVPKAAQQKRQRRGAANEGESASPASPADENGKITQATTGGIVPKIVQDRPVGKLAQRVRSAGNLCERCATIIARALVAIKTSDSSNEALQAIPDCIGNYASSILLPSLVSFAELWANIDIIPTTQSFSLLYGSVRDAIANSTKQDEKGKAAEGNGQGWGTRFRYAPKASRRERTANGEVDNRHPTVKPLALMRYLVRLVSTPDGAVILDPFMGSGTTALACMAEGQRFVGIEQDEESMATARGRIEAAVQEPTLFK